MLATYVRQGKCYLQFDRPNDQQRDERFKELCF